MNVEQARALFEALGSKASSQSEDWVRGPCVLAPFLHRAGKDHKPSFGLKCTPGEPGRFHCFTCESGSLSHLLQTIEFWHAKDPTKFHGSFAKAREIIENEEIDMPILGEYQEFAAGPKKQFEPLPEYFRDSFPPAEQNDRAYQYLQYRGLNAAEMLVYDIRYDANHDRVVFPYYDVFKRLAGLRGRGIQFPGEYHGSPHHDYVWNKVNNAGLVWYGEPHLDTPGPVVLVEGQFDRIKVERVYPKVLANLTAKPTAAKLHKLIHCEGVVLMMDGDDTGRKATEKIAQALLDAGTKVATVLLPWDGVNKTDPDKQDEQWLRNSLREIGLVT